MQAFLALLLAPRPADCFKGLLALVKNNLASVPLVADLRSPAMRPRHWDALRQATKVGAGRPLLHCTDASGTRLPPLRTLHCSALLDVPETLPPRPPPLPPCQVSFVLDGAFRLQDLLGLGLHQFAEDVGEITDRAQKEEKMEQAGRGGGACASFVWSSRRCCRLPWLVDCT